MGVLCLYCLLQKSNACMCTNLVFNNFMIYLWSSRLTVFGCYSIASHLRCFSRPGDLLPVFDDTWMIDNIHNKSCLCMPYSIILISVIYNMCKQRQINRKVLFVNLVFSFQNGYCLEFRKVIFHKAFWKYCRTAFLMSFGSCFHFYRPETFYFFYWFQLFFVAEIYSFFELFYPNFMLFLALFEHFQLFSLKVCF